MKKVLISVGTRPNFIKITQFKRIAASNFPGIEIKILHTGQHYDHKMAEVFFEQFGLRPDFFLNLESRTPASQIAEIIEKTEKLLSNYQPDLVLVPGDVNSTLAVAICAKKMGIKIGHIESGLRSRDDEMPEEHNRLVTDLLSDYLFISEQSGLDNLTSEKSEKELVYVGNTMIDTIVHFEKQIDQASILEELEVHPKEYILLTTHRPSNVDHQEGIETLIDIICSLSVNKKIVFPIHPRTRNKADQFGLLEKLESLENLVLCEPQAYFSFQKLIKNAAVVVTDSGGIQEETTFYKVPCLTIRENTERPSTTTIGSNKLVKFNGVTLIEEVNQILKDSKDSQIPKHWDGNATQRILEFINSIKF